MSEFPDLYALVIRLRPEHGSALVDPRGHGAQALFLDLLRQVAPDLATQLHADALSKPYTVAGLPARGHARSNGNPRLGLLPTAEIIFGSIARRWNELAPTDLRLDLDEVEAAARDTLVSRYALETVQINLGKGPQKGFLGLCSYELPPDPAQAR